MNDDARISLPSIDIAFDEIRKKRDTEEDIKKAVEMEDPKHEIFVRWAWFIDFQRAILDYASSLIRDINAETILKCEKMLRITVSNTDDFIRMKYVRDELGEVLNIVSDMENLYGRIVSMYDNLDWEVNNSPILITQTLPYGIHVRITEEIQDLPETVNPAHLYLVIYYKHTLYDIRDIGEMNWNYLQVMTPIGEENEYEFKIARFFGSDLTESSIHIAYCSSSVWHRSDETIHVMDGITVDCQRLSNELQWTICPRDILKSTRGAIWSLRPKATIAIESAKPKLTVTDLPEDTPLIFRTPSNTHSYADVLNVIDECCNSAEYQNIYCTIYRTEKNSQVVQSLIAAAERGANVTVYLEIRANGDEQHNIEIAEMLSSYPNIKVLTSFNFMKVHAKTFLAATQNGTGIAHFSTGNYNAETGKQYLDTQIIGKCNWLVYDAIQLFQSLITQDITSYISINDRVFRVRGKLLPESQLTSVNRVQYTLLQRCNFLLNYEKPNSAIVFKCNHITDRAIIDALYTCAARGIKVHVICRTTVGLIPATNLKIYRVCGEYLEHDRFYYFTDGESKWIYFSSADLMNRNLHKRTESLIPIEDQTAITKYLDDFKTWTDKRQRVEEITLRHVKEVTKNFE